MLICSQVHLTDVSSRQLSGKPGGRVRTVQASKAFLAPGGPSEGRLGQRDVQEAHRADSGTISDPSGRTWKTKTNCKIMFFALFHVAPQTSSRSSKSAPGRSQNDHQERPGAARDAAQDSPESAPRATQTRLPNGPGGEVGPNWHKRFWTPHGLLYALRGSIFVQFSSFGKHSKSCPVDEACASIRPAPLYLLV